MTNTESDPKFIADDFVSTPIGDLISLSGKVAVVTGGATGIGAAIVRRLAEAGAVVVIADLDEEAGRRSATEIGMGVEASRLDVTNASAVAEFVDGVAKRHGRLDIWVNNAGVFPSTPILDMSDEEWAHVVGLNLTGAFTCSREAARQMVIGERGGVILNISSVSGYRGRKGMAHYSSSKHAIRGLTRSLAVELGSRGIRSLAIAPTMVVTPRIAAMAPRAQSRDSHSTDVYSELPLGRPGVPDDVARVALFCVSDLASFMTGSTLAADAGQMSM